MGRPKRQRPEEPPLSGETRALRHIEATLGGGRQRLEGERAAFGEAIEELRKVAQLYAVDSPEREALRRVGRALMRRLREVTR